VLTSLFLLEDISWNADETVLASGWFALLTPLVYRCLEDSKQDSKEYCQGWQGDL
jgi:hypothetical protein